MKRMEYSMNRMESNIIRIGIEWELTENSEIYELVWNGKRNNKCNQVMFMKSED